MSRIGMKHLAGNYQGLAFGKGGLTSSTSPLWSPGGAYSYGGFYGEADGAEVAPVAPVVPPEDKGMLAKFYEKKTDILGFAVPTALLMAGAAYYLFFRKGAPMPLRMNAWVGENDSHADAAHIRWRKAKNEADKLKKYQEKLAKRADMKLAAWKKRAKAKSYKYATKKKAKKAYTTKTAVNGITMYYIDGKRVKKDVALGTASKVANPRRRKNGTKKGMARKTARRAYTKNRKVSPYNKFVGKQMRAGKSMKQAARAWRNR